MIPITSSKTRKPGTSPGFRFDASAPVRTPRNGLGLLTLLGLRCETWRTAAGVRATNCCSRLGATLDFHACIFLS
jgi:hypothetical protein